MASKVGPAQAPAAPGHCQFHWPPLPPIPPRPAPIPPIPMPPMPPLPQPLNIPRPLPKNGGGGGGAPVPVAFPAASSFFSCFSCLHLLLCSAFSCILWILLNSLWGQITSGLLILIMLWPGCLPAFSQDPHRSKSSQTTHLYLKPTMGALSHPSQVTPWCVTLAPTPGS